MIINRENPCNILKGTRPLNSREIRLLQEGYLYEAAFGSVDKLVSAQYVPGRKCTGECHPGCTC